MNKLAPNLTQAEIEYMKQNFGADELYIDQYGNVREKINNQIVAHHKNSSELKSEEIIACREYFNGLPAAVKGKLLEAALSHSVSKAIEQMSRYNIERKENELWGLSYEELAKMTAEGILLGEK